MTAYGYARISTDKQDLDGQRRALEAAGCNPIITEQTSGRGKRPELQALLAKLGEGDTLTVFKLDRLSRNVPDFYATAQRITEAGAAVRSLTEQLDTSTALGRAMLGLLAVFAQLEADQTSERVRSGLDAARKRGKRLGRPRAVSHEVEGDIKAELEAGASLNKLAVKYRTSVATVRRIKER